MEPLINLYRPEIAIGRIVGYPSQKCSGLDIADETMRYYNVVVTKYECSVEGDRADNKYGWVRCNPNP